MSSPFTELRAQHQPEGTNWTWMWRGLHALNNQAWADSGWRTAQDYIDAGYCLDRYSIEDADGNVTRCLP
jgi:YD repeat-containing protein